MQLIKVNELHNILGIRGAKINHNDHLIISKAELISGLNLNDSNCAFIRIMLFATQDNNLSIVLQEGNSNIQQSGPANAFLSLINSTEVPVEPLCPPICPF